MSRCFRALWVAASISFLAFAKSSYAENYEQQLALWIERQIHFFPDSNGGLKLFVRRAPIRAFVYSEKADQQDRAKQILGLFSKAAILSHEFTKVNPNIIAIVSSPIHDGEKPNRDLLQRIGLPEGAIEVLMRSSNWTNGCGIYSFTGDPSNRTDGEVTLSLVLADSRLQPTKISECVTEGIIRAFGMRVTLGNALNVDDGYFQYLLLASALRACDSKIVASSFPKGDNKSLKQAYINCAVEHLLQKL